MEARKALRWMRAVERIPSPPDEMGKFICRSVFGLRSGGSLRISEVRLWMAVSTDSRTGVMAEGSEVRAM